MLRVVSLVLVVVILSACAVSSRPVQHLQLSAGDGVPAGRDSPVIVIDAVLMPDYLLRDELLYREDDYRLRYDPFQRWAEPLDLGIQRVLGTHLEGLLDTRQIIRFPHVPRGPADWYLRVEVERFEYGAATVTVKAEGRWSRADQPDSTTLLVNFEKTQALADPDGPAIAETLSALLRDFAAALTEPMTPYAPAAGAPITLESSFDSNPDANVD